VLPVAGLGTRFLPATKQMAKEMLPVVDKPLIQYAVEEAREAGIEQFCFVTGRGKTMLVDQFDLAYELERTLTERNKTKELDMLRAQALPPGSIISTRQQVPLGPRPRDLVRARLHRRRPLRHPAARRPDAVRGELHEAAADAYNETGGNVVAIEEVPKERVSSYGVIAPGATKGNLVEVTGLVEKPPVEKAPSNLTVIGRYVLMPEVIGHLAKFEKGAGGEIQLTDGMAKLIGNQPFHGLRYEGRRFDCGDKGGYLEAQIAFALAREDMAPKMRDIIKRYS
jgi:UTP--glucose-1-phosphate uridylyltransferase